MGLNEAYDVIEGFPLDQCVPSRALQWNYRRMLDKTSKTWSNCNIYAERKGICNW